MGWGVIHDQDVQRLTTLLTEVLQKRLEAGAIECRHLPPAGLARGRFHGRVQPVVLIEGLVRLDWLDALSGQAPGQR